MLELLAALLLLLLLLLYFKASRRTYAKAPPGPKGIPVFGSLFQMDYTNIHLTLDNFSCQYGDIVQIRIMGQTFICLNSSEAIRDVFLHEPNASLTAARPVSAVGKYAIDNYADVVFGSLSNRWIKCRKLSYRLINTYGEDIFNMRKATTASLGKLKDKMIKMDGISMDPEDFVEYFILDILETIIVGHSSGRHGKLQKILKDIDMSATALANMGLDVLYTLLPFLRYLPLKHSRLFTLFESQKVQMMDTLAQISKENPNTKGIYIELMEVLKEQEQAHDGLSYYNIRGILLDLVAGGFNTTRGAILSLVHILAKDPKLQRTLQAEVDSAIGRERMPTLSDRENCPIITAVLFETLRYISHLPVAGLHSASDFCEIKGYFVEKNTTIIPNLWTAHHSHKEWNQPYEFKPERFLDDSGCLLPSTHPMRKRFLAFGCGKRSCTGEVFAKSRMFLFVSTLMQTVTIKEPDDVPLPEFELKEMLPGLVMQPKPYRVKFVFR